jgi:endoglycosylceramidase
MSLLRGLPAVAGAVLLLGACTDNHPYSAPWSEGPQLRRDGRWLVDPDGRVVLLHGVNLVWKVDPFVPPATPAGFIAADADFLAQHGFNSARIGTLWVGIAPDAPGQVRSDYLDAWDRVVKLLAARRIWMLFDFHQDMLGHRFQGEGVPEWVVDRLAGPSSTLLGPPRFGFPFNYFTPQVSEAFDNLWAERGEVWDAYRDAWVAVARRWKNQPYSMGYDLLNEPWAGQEWPACIFPPMVGCPDSDAEEIQPFFEHAIAGIRSVDPHNIVWIEPQLLAGGTGSPTGFTPIAGERQLGYSVHNYCPLSALAQSLQAFAPFDTSAAFQGTCEDFETSAFEQARITAERIGAVELVTEFGATDDLTLLARVTRLADENLVGWQYWAYKQWLDPTTQSQSSGGQGMFAADDDLSSVKLEKLKILSRPYPQYTAGTPLALAFDLDTGAFSYRYAPRAGGGATEIFVPAALHYPGGYVLEVSGADVASPPQSDRVVLRARPGAAEVTVTISR